MLHSALAPEVDIGVRDCKTGKEMWDALLAIYEGNEEMKESRREMLTQKFNLFNHFPGGTLENQIQRFVALVSYMKTHDISLEKNVINKKLLNALLRNWDTNVTLIKRTRDLARMTLSELISLLKSYEMDDKQRLYNHATSYNNAGVLTNSALMSQQGMSALTGPSTVPLPVNLGTFVNQSGYFPAATQHVNQTLSTAQPTNPSALTPTQFLSNITTAFAATNSSVATSKDFEQAMAFMTGVMNCYHAFIVGRVKNNIDSAELLEVHPDDVEEMDITWQMAMAVFRARNFVKKTGKGTWDKIDGEIGWNKAKLQFYNCHEPGHYARECKQPKRERADPNVTVTVSSAARPAQNVVSTSNITVTRPAQGTQVAEPIGTSGNALVI
ncbi:putative transcription factor interactor and regulator CCHC(Zn) family [Helianthus annuus]|uniref:Transcription factor interactor and regulator CCHC(Zn) family n=1 Tax=Helianthus annuus TaxID=4232 RepID=A0A9K3GZ02_HELAN|nr:putative transcription factor interactor and regulator CCHC(Zn) family [Helianthus annuus]KAJ0820027.1 putative transcription factor interactor and regulator CCHC(Zn) family [Helianthus annuus]